MRRIAERNASVCGWPSSTVDDRRAALGREELVEDRGSPSSSPCRACSARKTRSAEVRQTTSTAVPASVERAGGRDHLGEHGAHADERDVAARRSAVAQHVAAREHLRAPLARAPPAPPGCAASACVDRPRAEAEVGGRAAAATEAAERGQQRPLEILAEGGLPGDAARLLETDRGRDDRLVRAALGRERDAGRRADEDRLPAGVDAERPRLERAVDERVVDRPDRQQRLAVARPGRAELAEQPDEVALGDAELDVLAVRATRASA